MAESDFSNIKELFFDDPTRANPMWAEGSAFELSPPDYIQDYPDVDIKDDLINDSYTNNDTLDINLRPQQMTVPIEFPISPIGPPKRDCFSGKHNFQVEIHSADTHKKKYLYSSKLERLYVDASCDFPINFKWNEGPPEMLVRACVVFMDQDQAEKQVETCPNHDLSKSGPSPKENTPEFIKKWKNVLHSSRNDDTDGVYYCGDKNTWYSTVVKFDGSCEKKSHAYRFICKNSCPMGINRRHLGIIFTLEDLCGEVCGRVQVGVRVCACPRRDMYRDERERPSECAAPPRKRSKEPRHELDGDERALELPAFKVRGVAAAVAGLDTMINMMELHKRRTNDQHMNAETEQFVQQIKNIISKLKK
ncbi:cellular tumor antigen p53-like [Aphomia sociella]